MYSFTIVTSYFKTETGNNSNVFFLYYICTWRLINLAGYFREMDGYPLTIKPLRETRTNNQRSVVIFPVIKKTLPLFPGQAIKYYSFYEMKTH